MKLAVVIGHNKDAQGAYAVAPISESEYRFNRKVAYEMQDRAGSFGLQIKVIERQGGMGYASEIAQAYQEVDVWQADASIELHFNSYRYTSTGSETLSSWSEDSRFLAGEVQKRMVAVLGLRDRGVKVKSSKDRGGRSLYAAKAPAILVEPFFGSNQSDCEAAAKLGVEGFAKMYLSGVKAYEAL